MTIHKTAGEALAAARATRNTTEQTVAESLSPLEQADWDRKMLAQLISDEQNRLIVSGLESGETRLRYRKLGGLLERLRMQSLHDAR